ncbi:MADS-box protein SOC1-like [Trifolium pratense]|uniref:MADS-box protein SOC1-like n=1 Tax=Trifolium pratense TaxID=57577 RepID=A0A2K3LGF3_TRIPR|nr:MADS-box protein SOC1-like [Trifolium pratense]
MLAKKNCVKIVPRLQYNPGSATGCNWDDEKALLAENSRLSKQPQPQPEPAAKDHQRENQPYAESSPSSDVVTELFIGLHRSN